MTEVEMSDAGPRFSDEAYVSVASRLIAAAASCQIALSEPDAVYLANVALKQGLVPREFEAARLAAWHSRRTDLAERLRRHADLPQVCADPGHDIRWCSRCEALEDGLLLAADLIEQWTGPETPEAG